MARHDAPPSDYLYDVFLSFRGETRYGFTGHLYSALCKSGINAFIDSEELRFGDEIEPILLEAIDKSRMSMVVLCENYASSSWCLRELVKIIDCHDNKGQQVLAIFYKVEPSDVQEQKNSYEGAMFKHERRFGQDSEKVKAWRAALSRVCDLSREHCRIDTYESGLIKKIIKDTLAKLPPLPSEIRHIVGLDSRFEQVKSLIDIESNNNVRILEIFGAGGIGKTTLAKDLYDKIKNRFGVACFLANVREKSKQGLEHLQKIMLYEMGGETEIMIGSIFKGSSEIKRRLGNERVLLVLDDVDAVKQLEALAGGGEWFGSGSRIIITTRDTSVLYKHVLHDVIIKKYEMEVLNNGDSLELFCWYAFNTNGPAQNMASISSRAIRYAKGFPMALKVIGSHLKSKRIEEWEKELDEYEKVANDAIHGVLERSYNSLFELDQKSFLDIACFFKGEKWKYVQRILKACDFFPVIRVFVSKCLITIDENECLKMHDLIQDMGREIVKRESLENPGHRSRLWSYEEIIQVLKRDSGSSTIEGIMLDPPKVMKVDHWANSAFKKMDNLRILIVRKTIFSKGPTYLPNELRLIDWEGYPSKSFPPNFNPHRIVDINLSYSSLVLKKSFKIFKDLTFINLSQCQSVTQIPDVSSAENLRVLTIEKCQNLERFHKSVGILRNLVYLSASECNALKSFVKEMYLPSLEVLSFNFCRRLEHFPQVTKTMDKTLKMCMINTAIKEFPESISNLTGLEYMDMSMCRGLKNLPSSFLLLLKLITLKLDGCSQLGGSFERLRESHSAANDNPNLMTLSLSETKLSYEDLSAILEIFPKLEDLNVSFNGFVSLPKSVGRSLHLKSLHVSYCRYLKKISGLPSSIQNVDAKYCQSLTSETSNMLWSKVKQMERIQVVMPKTEIPEWFSPVRNEEVPYFWARCKFPAVTFAFMFKEDEIKMDASYLAKWKFSDNSHSFSLHLFIDGIEISHRYFSVGEDDVLLGDLRVLFDLKEWQDLDGYLGDNWKAIQVKCDSRFTTLSSWGVYAYNQETENDYIKFRRYYPHTSRERLPPTNLVAKSSSQQVTQAIRHVVEKFIPGDILDSALPMIELGEGPSLPKVLVRSFRNAKAGIGGRVLAASAYGASLKQESDFNLVEMTEPVKENVGEHIDDSAHQFIAEAFRAESELMKEKQGSLLDTDMPIILEGCHFNETPTRLFWGNLVLKSGGPAMHALMSARGRDLLRARLWENNYFRGVVLLKCQGPSTEEAFSSSNEETLEEQYLHPGLQALLRTIERDTMRYNNSYGEMKASFVLSDAPFPSKYLLEKQIIHVKHTFGMLGSNSKNTDYGWLRMEDKNRRLHWTLTCCNWMCVTCWNCMVLTCACICFPLFLVCCCFIFFGRWVGIISRPVADRHD